MTPQLCQFKYLFIYTCNNTHLPLRSIKKKMTFYNLHHVIYKEKQLIFLLIHRFYLTLHYLYTS